MLLEFYGKECPHCVRMKPLVEQLEREEGVKFESYEVWHDTANEQKMEQYDKGLCGGVPFFYNTDTSAYVCGEVPYDKLKGLLKKKAA